MSFPTPPIPIRKRDKIINQACTIAAEDPAAQQSINEMAQILAARIPKLGIQGARRLLASIGLALSADDLPSASQIEKGHQ